MSSGLDSIQYDAHRRVVAPVAEDLEARATEMADMLVELYLAELPEVFRDAETAEAARTSIAASIRAIARNLREYDGPPASELPPETIAFTRDGARQGLPIAGLLRTYRLGLAALWHRLVPEFSVHAQDSGQLALAIDFSAARLFGYVDAAVMLAEEVYATERERFARTAAAVRAETISAILDGTLADPEAASRRLRHELARTHVGAWAWVEHAPDSGDVYELLEAALAEFARAAGVADPLVQPLGSLAVAGWISGAGSPDMAALAASRLPAKRFPEVRIAVGEPAAGVAGFCSSHAQASSARRVATLADRPAGSVTLYASVALQALASADVEHARAFVRRELGPLATRDDTTLRLAATLRAYLEEHASRSRAAKRLGIHENTVSYRIRQVEEILDRSVEDNTLNLRVALALAPVVGDA